MQATQPLQSDIPQAAKIKPRIAHQECFRNTTITLVVLSVLAVIIGYVTYAYGQPDAVNCALWGAGSLTLFFTLVANAIAYCSKNKPTPAASSAKKTEPRIPTVKVGKESATSLTDWPSVLAKAKDGLTFIKDWNVIYDFLKGDPNRALAELDDKGNTILFLAVEDGNNMAVTTIDHVNRDAKGVKNKAGETPLEVARRLQESVDEAENPTFRANLEAIIYTLEDPAFEEVEQEEVTDLP